MTRLWTGSSRPGWTSCRARHPSRSPWPAGGPSLLLQRACCSHARLVAQPAAHWRWAEPRVYNAGTTRTTWTPALCRRPSSCWRRCRPSSSSRARYAKQQGCLVVHACRPVRDQAQVAIWLMQVSCAGQRLWARLPGVRGPAPAGVHRAALRGGSPLRLSCAAGPAADLLGVDQGQRMGCGAERCALLVLLPSAGIFLLGRPGQATPFCSPGPAWVVLSWSSGSANCVSGSNFSCTAVHALQCRLDRTGRQHLQSRL